MGDNMNRNPEFIIAKYIPDLQRMEPRNIGVIVWTPDELQARFIGEKEGRPGEVDGRSVPSFITSLSTYKQWVQFWQNEIRKNEIQTDDGGKIIPISSPDYIDAFVDTSKGNFVLSKAGEVLEKASGEELSRLVDYLFSMIVDLNVSEEPRDLTLDELCDNLLEKSKLISNPNYKPNLRVQCKVKNATDEFTFNHAYQNGRLERLYHRVSFPTKRKTITSRNVHDTAWMFEKVVENNLIDKSRTAALVFLNDEQKNDVAIENSLNVLSVVTRVMNLKDEENTVLNEFEALAKMTPHA